MSEPRNCYYEGLCIEAPFQIWKESHLQRGRNSRLLAQNSGSLSPRQRESLRKGRSNVYYFPKLCNAGFVILRREQEFSY